VRGIRRRELQSLFPGFQLRLRRVTLAPPLARLIAPRSALAALVLEDVRLLNTHYLGLLRRA
jgi:hypothetical protein